MWTPEESNVQMSKHVEEKCWKLKKLFPIIKDQKGAEFLQNLTQKMTLELDLKFNKVHKGA